MVHEYIHQLAHPQLQAWYLLLAPNMGAWQASSVRIFSRSTLRAFSDVHADVRQALYAWFAEVKRATWKGPNDVKTRYPSASFVARNRIVFNIKGNQYRIVVDVKYEYFTVYIRFIGTHDEYNKIDATTI